MLKKDYLLAQITELAKKFAQLMQQKKEGEDIIPYVDKYYANLNLSADWLINAEPDDIIRRVGDWQLVELLVKMMIEDPRFENDISIISKARTLLFEVQELDRTYSFERIELKELIEKRLKKI